MMRLPSTLCGTLRQVSDTPDRFQISICERRGVNLVWQVAAQAVVGVLDLALLPCIA
jgi:hypothetical protein